MKARLISLVAVLLAGLAAYLLSSGAPTRVHVAVALTWGPLLFFLSLIGWARGLSGRQKSVLIAALMAVGGGALAYVTSLTVSKGYFTVTSWIATTVLLLVAFGAVLALSHLCERILTRWWLGRKM